MITFHCYFLLACTTLVIMSTTTCHAMVGDNVVIMVHHFQHNISVFQKLPWVISLRRLVVWRGLMASQPMLKWIVYTTQVGC